MNFNIIEYISKIQEHYNDFNVAKILKSTKYNDEIFRIIRNDLISKKVRKTHIVYIDFKELKFGYITCSILLNRYIRSLKKNKLKYYIFINEINYVDYFEKAIVSLVDTGDFNIFIFNSGNKVLKRRKMLKEKYINVK